MQSTVEEELAKCVAAHTHAQFERHESTQRHELELRAVMVVEQACHRVLMTLAAQAEGGAPQAEEVALLAAASARFGRAGAEVAGVAWVGEGGAIPGGVEGRFAEVGRAARLLDRLPAILVELAAHPEGEAVRLGLA
jgi:hypothetical protein